MEQDNPIKNQHGSCFNNANQQRIIDIFSNFIEDRIDSIDGTEVIIKKHIGDAADMVINLIKTSNCR